MSTHFLVVSNPPHGTVDAAGAAAHFGLTPAEARMKANFPAPEIWLAGSDRRRMEAVQSALGDCGLSTVVIAGQDLVTVPERKVVQSFSMEDSCIAMRSGEGEFTVDYDAPVAGVYCKPAADVFMGGRKGADLAGDLGRPSSSVMLDRMSRSGSSGAIQSETAAEAFLDLFAPLNGGEARWSLIAGATDFSSLQSVGRDPLHALVTECERAFSALSLDRRLENVRVRARVVVGQLSAHQEQRKLFSFGSLALAKLLDEISPDLHDLTQSELGSRLSYLMRP
ncbi:MAG: hypothetical protein JSW71_08870 [Gemmatimonadota bacterium]|nr:MAG: hypothetical protein JSW71_08870 [Gemmatimonadota bacterium]